MAQRTSRQTNGSALGAAVHRLEQELGSIQKQLRSQGRDLEKRLERGRRELASRRQKLETRGRKQLKSLLADARRSSAYKRARSLTRDAEKRLGSIRKDAGKQLESGVETVLSSFQIATKSDVQRIDRRLRSLNRKLDELEKARASRSRGSSEERSAAHA